MLRQEHLRRALQTRRQFPLPEPCPGDTQPNHSQEPCLLQEPPPPGIRSSSPVTAQPQQPGAYAQPQQPVAPAPMPVVAQEEEGMSTTNMILIGIGVVVLVLLLTMLGGGKKKK
jgi:hypothetical protein